jgi:hypothetical protein
MWPLRRTLSRGGARRPLRAERRCRRAGRIVGGAGEVLVSQTVEDLVAGSGMAFQDRGVAELKGVPGERRLFAVER